MVFVLPGYDFHTHVGMKIIPPTHCFFPRCVAKIVPRKSYPGVALPRAAPAVPLAARLALLATDTNCRLHSAAAARILRPRSHFRVHNCCVYIGLDAGTSTSYLKVPLHPAEVKRLQQPSSPAPNTSAKSLLGQRSSSSSRGHLDRYKIKGKCRAVLFFSAPACALLPPTAGLVLRLVSMSRVVAASAVAAAPGWGRGDDRRTSGYENHTPHKERGKNRLGGACL